MSICWNYRFEGIVLSRKYVVTSVSKASVADCAAPEYLNSDNFIQRKLFKMVVSVVGYVIIDPQGPSIWVTLDSEHSIKIQALHRDGWTHLSIKGSSVSMVVPSPGCPAPSLRSPKVPHLWIMSSFRSIRMWKDSSLNGFFNAP